MIVALEKMIRMIFEPVGLACLLGLWGIIRWRTPKTLKFVLIYPIIIFLVFAWLWRCGLSVLSSRYFVIFLPFAIIFAAIGICSPKLPVWGRRILLFVIVISCLVKVFLNFSQEDYLRKALLALREDAKAYEHVAIGDFIDRKWIIKYYLPDMDYFLFPQQKQTLAETVSARMFEFAYWGDVAYIICFKNTAEAPLAAEALKVGDSQLSLLYSTYVNRKRKRQLCIYKFEPHIRKKMSIELLDRASPQSRNLITNGDFEQQQESSGIADKAAAFPSKDVKFFYERQYAFPADWSPNFYHGFEFHSNPEIELWSVEAISGKYSLRLRSDKLVSVMMEAKIPCRGEYDFSFTARGVRNSRFGLWLYFFENGSFYFSYSPGIVNILPGECFRYRFPLELSRKLEKNEMKICFGLLEGEILLDDLTLVEMDEASENGMKFQIDSPDSEK